MCNEAFGAYNIKLLRMLEYLLWLEEVSSTQDFLREKDIPYGTVVVANRQTSGRGRHGRVWHSQDGGLYFSFLISENFRDVATLPLVLGYALCLFMDEQGLPSAIKWPNDVYIRGKKVAGILVERTRKGLICGIGINVNQTEFPKDIYATSMYMCDGVKRDQVATFLDVISKVCECLYILKQSGFSYFRDRIKSKLLFLEQEVIVYTEKPTVGLLKDLGEDGSLIILTSEGQVKIVSGDLTLRGLGF